MKLIKRPYIVMLAVALSILVGSVIGFAGVLMNNPKFQAIDANGAPLNGGKLYTYIQGTTTAKATYSDRACTTPNANPVVLDSRGEATIYGAGIYKLVLKDSSDSTIWTMDNVEFVGGGGSYNLYVDPSETDQGAAGNGGSLYDLLTALGTSKKATVILTHTGAAATTTYTAGTSYDASGYGNAQFKVENGALISVSTGKTLSLPPNSVVAQPNQHVFTGAGVVKFAKFSRVTPENFGAKGDGTTNDYTAFVNALKSGCVENGGVHIAVNQQKMYIINNGANAGITLDADNLPDSTVTATSNESLPVFEIVGYGTPGHFNPSGNAPAGGLKFTGTGPGIKIISSTRKWRGQIRLENLNLLGGTSATRVAGHGIWINGGMDLGNIIRNVDIAYFTGNGFYSDDFNTYDNILEDIRAIYNDGYGFRLLCNEQVFLRCKAVRNGSAGVYFETVTAVQWIGGTAAHNYAPQVSVGNVEHLSVDTYLEGQLDANVPYTALDGTGVGMIKLQDNVYNSTFRARGLHADVSGGTTQNEQYIVYFGAAAVVRGCALYIMAPSGFADQNGDAMAVVGPLGTATASQCTIKTYKSGGVDVFADTTVEQAFQMVSDSAKDYTRIKTIIGYPINFYKLNITDNTADQPIYTDVDTGITGQSYRLRMPWGCSLVGISWVTGAGVNTLTVHHAASGFSQVLDATTGTKRYAVGAYPIASNGYFEPLVNAVSVGESTSDLAIYFWFAINIDEQDRDS